MKSLGVVRTIRQGNMIADIQLGVDERFHTLIWNSLNPYRTQRLIGPHES